MKKIAFLCFMFFVMTSSCSHATDEIVIINNNQAGNNPDETNETDSLHTESTNLKILALGDSYTIGQSVCETCRFPIQLKDSLINYIDTDISVDIIAKTGWTTTTLINEINIENPLSNYNLVTLLIGVNNQFQGKPFSHYQNEFPILIQKATQATKGDKSNIIVISIPDYAFTPFGTNRPNPEIISAEIAQYNAFAKTYCEERNITFINITDITQLGLTQPDLVASDGLHPSQLAYSKFVERILPIAFQKIQ